MKHGKLLIFTLWACVFIGAEASSQCGISNVRIEPLGCYEDNKFDVLINFDYYDIGNEGFRINGNGEQYGQYSYEDLPLILTGFSGDCITPWEFIIRDMENPVCGAFVVFGKYCCDINCDFEIQNFETGECAPSGTFDLSFQVVNQGNSIVNYEVFANDEFLTEVRSTGEAVHVEDYLSSNDFFEYLKVCVKGNPDCCIEYEFHSPCFCGITNIRSKAVMCDDSTETYHVLIDMDRRMGSDSVVVGGELGFIGRFAYSDLPLLIGPIAFGEIKTELLFVDRGNFFCFAEHNIPTLISCDTMCRLDSIQLIPGNCNFSNSFYAEIRFQSNNPGLEGFSTIVNGDTLMSSFYDRDVYFIGPLPGDCSTMYEFEIIDNEYSECRTSFEMQEPVCCLDCSFSMLELKEDCVDGEIKALDIQFDANGQLSDTFQLTINGVLMDAYPYTELPIKVLLNPALNQDFIILISDLANPDCNISGNFEFFCEENEHEGCLVLLNSAEIIGCEENQFFNLMLEINSQGTHADSFLLFIDEILIAELAYTDSLEGGFHIIEQLSYNCGEILIKIQDSSIDTCFSELSVFNNCCYVCEISDVLFRVHCVDFMVIGLEILEIRADENVERVTLSLGDQEQEISVNDLPFIFEFQAENGQTSKLQITNSIDPDCQAEFFIITDCSDCTVKEIRTEVLVCEDLFMDVLIDLDHNEFVTDHFFLSLNGESAGQYLFSDLPLNVENLIADGATEYIFGVRVTSDLDCTLFSSIQEDCPSRVGESQLQDQVLVSYTPTYWSVSFENPPVTGWGYELFDVAGRLVLANHNADITNCEIPHHSFPQGIYYLRVSLDRLITSFMLYKF
jgi:hypothetical protein